MISVHGYPSSLSVMTEDVGAMLQKGLTEWWNEETEYMLQRIERWAAYARGYNRLRSQRLSRGRMTMQSGQEPRWSVSSNKLIIEDPSWSPRFHALKKSRRKSRPEETKINCCGTFNYQSNSNLDSNCLETYRYDHSIYFKTIGDIKNSKKDLVEEAKDDKEDRISVSSEELVEWDAKSVSDFIANQLLEDGLAGENIKTIFAGTAVGDCNPIDSVSWSNVDLTKLDLNEEDVAVIDEENNSTVLQIEEESNNNCTRDGTFVEDVNLKNQQGYLDWVAEGVDDVDHEATKSCLDIRRNRKASRKAKHSPIVGDNDVIWPSVLLNYTTNVDRISSPHHYRQKC
ncbi:uncharacterized protein LOC116434056 [Nomia melanderi]|uniref:uncharacterized protein LOC116434056 n=1 Tax=Nomia melanderi TaxID=2448451 RepID=UPI001303FC14|nr:uncharacterized protein LOC116434056 [Nomia melanderi]